MEGLNKENIVVTVPYSVILRRLKDGSYVKVVDIDELFKEKD